MANENNESLVDQVGALVPADSKSSGMMEVQAQRAVAQVQGSMAVAKRFPRSEDQAIARIKSACARRGLAEAAAYEYRRGGSTISGPSIRMAEAMAQAWGNLDTGVVELERRHGESQMMAYCVDLETNYWKQVTFAVPHVRETRDSKKMLTESRDVYEAVMNQGSRRLRNCILAVIPGDITDMAMAECEKTLAKSEEPLGKRIETMMVAIKELGVTQKMIETKFQCNYKALTERQVSKIRGIYQSLKDGMAVVKDFFEEEGVDPAKDIAAQMAKPKAPVTTSSEQQPKPVAPKPAQEEGLFENSPSTIHDPRIVK